MPYANPVARRDAQQRYRTRHASETQRRQDKYRKRRERDPVRDPTEYADQIGCSRPSVYLAEAIEALASLAAGDDHLQAAILNALETLPRVKSKAQATGWIRLKAKSLAIDEGRKGKLPKADEGEPDELSNALSPKQVRALSPEVRAARLAYLADSGAQVASLFKAGVTELAADSNDRIVSLDALMERGADFS